MSFILDALKKSEERRQQAGPARPVRRRVMGLQPSASGSRPRWLLLLLIPLALLTGWWLRGGVGTDTVPVKPEAGVTASLAGAPAPQAVEPVSLSVEPESVSLPLAPESPVPAVTASAVEDPGPQAVVSASPQVEPAPVPRPLGLESPVPAKLARKERTVSPAAERDRAVQQVAQNPQIKTLVAPRTEPLPVAATAAAWPLYPELSREVRARLPSLAMSMHFYASDPGRRLVRINDRLLYEGDWLTEEVQLVEVTPTGAVLDFMGLFFELRGSNFGG